MDGKSFIDQMMYDMYKSSVLTTDTTYRAMCLNWLNLVLKDISTRQENFHYGFLEMTCYFTTVAAQASYDLPSTIDGYKVFSVRRLDGDVRLDYVDPHIMDKYVPDPTVSSGNPYNYTLWANSIKLYPVPSAAQDIYLRYIRTITLLTDSAASTTLIPAKWDDVILCGALAKATRLKQKEKPALSNLDLKQEYESGIQRLITECGVRMDYNNVAESHRSYRSLPRFVSPAGQ